MNERARNRVNDNGLFLSIHLSLSLVLALQDIGRNRENDIEMGSNIVDRLTDFELPLNPRLASFTIINLGLIVVCHCMDKFLK